MDKITSNFHTHTFRCGHAYGEDEQYVTSAIDADIKVLGFSDHTPLPNVHLSWMRPEVETMDDYISSISSLRDKYAKDVTIYIGYEAEYQKKFVRFYKSILNNKIDYLILGQHCFIKGRNNSTCFYNAKENHKSYRVMKKYTDAVVKGIKSGLFLYVAHPDVIINGYQKFDKKYIKQANRIIKASIKYDVPLEINMGGIRANARNKVSDHFGYGMDLRYPFEGFWELVGKANAKVVIGVDAHKPDEFFAKENDLAYELVNKFNLQVVDPKDYIQKNRIGGN